MNTIDAIKTRRSVRRYNERKVSEETIRNIIDVATFAPSWKNSQTTRYIAVLDETIKNRIGKECTMGSENNIGIINSAPVLIVVCTKNMRSGYERDGSLSTSKGTHWQSFDAGIATSTLCLTAHEMGLCSVIMGIFEERLVKDVLSIGDDLSVSALVALGYNDNEFPAPKRKTSEELLTIIK